MWRIPAPEAEQLYDGHQHPEDLPRPHGEDLICYDEDDMHSYGVVSPLAVLGTLTGCIIGAAVSKSIIEDDHPTPTSKSDFHLICFDPTSW